MSIKTDAIKSRIKDKIDEHIDLIFHATKLAFIEGEATELIDVVFGDVYTDGQQAGIGAHVEINGLTVIAFRFEHYVPFGDVDE